MRSDQFSGLMLVALALYVGWENRVYPIGSLQEPGPGYMPLLLVIFSFCCCHHLPAHILNQK